MPLECTVFVHNADCTHWHTLQQTESGQLTHVTTQHSAHKMMQHHIIVRRQSEHAYHNSIRHFFVIHLLKEVLTEKEVKAGKDLH